MTTSPLAPHYARLIAALRAVEQNPTSAALRGAQEAREALAVARGQHR